MCGLAGFVDYGSQSTISTLKAMTSALAHRGPDDNGHSFYRVNNYQIGLGHRRLSIMDLSIHGHQPMSFAQLEIVYNGEVYNFREIRSELEQLGYEFHSDSDTEVILKSFHHWKQKAVDKFHGMFVIVIYDKQLETVTIFRDRAGVKPLYWYFNEKTFLFSSELKSFHYHPYFKININSDALAKYLQYGYIPQPNTIFKLTYKLKAGHYLVFDLKRADIKEKEYWNVVSCYNKDRLDISYEEAINHTDKLLHKAFNYRMISDVPVGIFLSGGYDSVAVASILQSDNSQKIKTFTMGFEEQGFDEAPFAKAITKYLGTEHVEHYCTQKDALDVIPTLVDIYDEPFGDVSAIPTILVSQIAKKEVTVALSADGGDETFAGYSKYKRALNYQQYLSLNPLAKKIGSAGISALIATNVLGFTRVNQLKRLQEVLNKSPNESLLKHLVYPDAVSVSNLLIDKPKDIFTCFDIDSSLAKHNDELGKMLAIDYKTYMVDDVLVKVDRASMSVSLECREPLLDHSIIDFIAQLPSDFKLRDGSSKDILKTIVHKYVPRHLVDRPKMGFGVPIHHWLNNELSGLVNELLDPKRLANDGIFIIEEIEQLKKLFYINPQNQQVAKLIWFILVFQMWFEKWMS